MTGNTPRKRVRGYYRADGTYVRGHYRERPGAGGPPSHGGGSSGRTSGSGSAGLGEVIAGFLVLMIALTVLAQIAG